LFEPANNGHDPDDFVFSQPNHLAKGECPNHLSVDKHSNDDDLAKVKQSDHSDVYEKSNDGQSRIKSKGFKGKRAKSNFGPYGKRGGNRKVNGIAPQQAIQDNNPEPILALTRCCSASRKVTKTQILLCQEKMEKETALSDVRRLTNKITKTKEVVKELLSLLKDSWKECRIGQSDSFWKEQYRPGKRYLPPIRVLGGSR
jgi:hypothetical protein